MKSKRAIAMALLLAMTVSMVFLPGCGQFSSSMKNTVTAMVDARTDTRLKEYTIDQWVDASVAGSLTADTPVDVKKDFYAAVNKDWLLEHYTDDKNLNDVQMFVSLDAIAERKRAIVAGLEDKSYLDNDSVGMSREEIAHAAELLRIFSAVSENSEKRNALGVEPLRELLTQIEEIHSLDDMTAYLLDFENRNFLGAPLVEISVGRSVDDSVNNHVMVMPILTQNLSLCSSDEYNHMTEKGVANKEINNQIVSYILGRLGYSEADISRLLVHSYELECDLVENRVYDVSTGNQNYGKRSVHIGMEELTELAGSYPIAEILKIYGYDHAEEFQVFEPDVIGRMKHIYTERNLERLKAFYIVHTVRACESLLDDETASAAETITQRGQKSSEEDSALKDAPQQVTVTKYVEKYLAAPLEMVYIAAYLNSDQKAEISKIVKILKNNMKQVFDEADWLPAASVASFKEKLDYMAEWVLFPDKYISYLGLELDENQNMLEMIRRISIHEKQKLAYRVNQKVDRTEWDLQELPTTTLNAVNITYTNTIAILAGYIASDFIFDLDAPVERNYARLATTVGHEITHGFDSIGVHLDKYGMSLLSADEVIEANMAFEAKEQRTDAWYATLQPVTGVVSYNGKVKVLPEAIADMGGMRTTLMAAAEIEGFDYDLFFRSYAELWRKACSLGVENTMAEVDVHPLAFLRSNVTVQQYDEFIKTYDLKPGDGMYVAPVNRIRVW